MAYIQKNIPSPNRIHDFRLNNFSGGLNNKSTNQEVNQASDVMNMSFFDRETMMKRHGRKLYKSFPTYDDIEYIDEYRPFSGDNELVVCTKDSLYIGDDKVQSVTRPIVGVNYMGFYMFVNGDGIYLYGSFPQETVGDIQKVIGTPTTNKMIMQLSNPPDNYTPLDETFEEGTKVYDYTNKKVWYEPCENEVADGHKGMNVLPEKPSLITLHRDRVYISGVKEDDDNVFISDVMNFYYFPVFLPIQLPPNNDKVVGLHVYHDSVVVGRHYDVYVIYGNTNRTDMDAEIFRLKRINTHTGFASNNAIDIVHNYLFYLGYDGNMYAMHTTQTNVDILATQIINQTVDLFKAPIDASKEDLTSAYSIFFDGEWWLCVGDKTMVYSYQLRAWTMYKHQFFNITSFYVLNYDLIMGDDHGRLLTIDKEVYSDLDRPYRGYWSSKVIDFESPSLYKHFRNFFVVAEAYRLYESVIDVKFEIDFTDVKDSHQIYNDISVWGRSKYGDRYISRNVASSLPVVIGRRGRTLRLTISNGYDIIAELDTYSDLNEFLGARDGYLVYIKDEGRYYIHFDFNWVLAEEEDLFQPMRVYEVNGEYELRGKR